MSDLFGNRIVGFPTRQLKYFFLHCVSAKIEYVYTAYDASQLNKLENGMKIYAFYHGSL